MNTIILSAVAPEENMYNAEVQKMQKCDDRLYKVPLQQCFEDEYLIKRLWVKSVEKRLINMLFLTEDEDLIG